MRTRRGVTLVEVLVAAVLLAIGLGGTMGAVVAAARLRDAASRRETVARVVGARLEWFARVACTATDGVVAAASDGVEETWRVTRTPGRSRLEGRAVARAPGRAARLALTHERRCP